MKKLFIFVLAISVPILLIGRESKAILNTSEKKMVLASGESSNIDLSKIDVNGDRIIDIQDLAEVSKNYNNQSVDNGWNAKSDINSDSRIDIYDLVIVSKNIGKTIPSNGDATVPPKSTPDQFNTARAFMVEVPNSGTPKTSDWRSIDSSLSSLYKYNYTLQMGKLIPNTNVNSKFFTTIKPILLGYLNNKFNFSVGNVSTIILNNEKYVNTCQREFGGYGNLGAYYNAYFGNLKSEGVESIATVLTDDSLVYQSGTASYVYRYTLKIKYTHNTSQAYMDKYGLQYDSFYYIDREVECDASMSYDPALINDDTYLRYAATNETNLSGLYIK